MKHVWTLDLCILRLPAPWKQMTSSWFLHQREHVRELCSNNRLTFVGADREIKEAIDQINNEKVGRELSQGCYKWVFHPPGASFLINEEILWTVLTEAEWIANSRPLTRNSSSINDHQPLTLSHILNIHPTVNLPPDMVDDSNKFTQKQWRQAQLWLTIIGSVGSGSTFPHYKNARSGRKHKGTCTLES